MAHCQYIKEVVGCAGDEAPLWREREREYKKGAYIYRDIDRGGQHAIKGQPGKSYLWRSESIASCIYAAVWQETVVSG